MPRTMRDGGYRLARNRDFARLVLPFLGILALPLLVPHPWTYGLALVAAPPLALAALWRQIRRSTRPACPRCRAGMRRHGDLRHGPVRFLCSPCDVIWDTGVDETTD